MNERIRRWGPHVAIVLLAIAVSFTSLGNTYAYDDGYIVAGNERIRSLANIPKLFTDSYWGAGTTAGGYRPLTLAMFAIEWFVGGTRPIAMHAANILIYAAMCLAVFLLARRFLPRTAAWIAAALFAVHPVHVEAVANLVGQGEVLTGLACVLGVWLYVRERDAGSMRWPVAFALVGCFVVAVLAKENGMVIPLLLLVAELTIVADRRPIAARFVTVRPFVLLLTLVGLVYIRTRAAVLGDLGGMPPHTAYVGLHLTSAHRVLTMIGMAKEWARLLLWPARLVAEYSPPMVPFAIEMGPEQLPGLLVLVVTFAALWAAMRRGWRDVSFGIWWTIVAMLPISGFLFTTGFILAERTLLLPSVGAMYAVVALGLRAWRALPRDVETRRPVRLALAGALAAIMLAGGLHSAQRQLVWRDNDILFPITVHDAPDSYRAHQILGAWLFAKGFRGEGEREMLEAIRLFPYDPIPPYLLAEEYRKKGACDRALPLYKWSLATTDTAQSFSLAPYSRCLLKLGRLDEARQHALLGIERGSEVRQYRWLLRQVDSTRIATLHPDSLDAWLRRPGTHIPPMRQV
ncbi:MAG: hypothetical protein HOQ11_07820, partial [Gemmatimonadaceae bacterium]|nr:hypothetical protein [Gemmatimonadaceae bacterium]